MFRLMNSEWYTTICLQKSSGKFEQEKRIIVQHGNASSHTSAQLSALLTGQNVELMGHLPYSPDLAPNDFSLSSLKKIMRDHRFSLPGDTVRVFKKPYFGGISMDFQMEME